MKEMQVNVFACIVFAGLCAGAAVVGQPVSGGGRWHSAGLRARRQQSRAVLGRLLYQLFIVVLNVEG